jgi:hypothetical protein
MHPKHKKDEFLYLRSQNWSLNRISKEIDVCRTTLIEWNREFDKALRVIRSLELDELDEHILNARQQDLARLAERQSVIEKELASRTLEDLPTEKLFRLASAIREEVNQSRVETRELAADEPYISDGLTFFERVTRSFHRAAARRQQQTQPDAPSPPDSTPPNPLPELPRR